MYHRVMSLAQTSTDVEPAETGLPLGPDSLVWKYFADNRMALLGPRAAVLQNMLPSLGQGVEDHSVWFAETLARLQRSIPPIFNTVYGADGVAAGHEVRDFHKHIKGKLPDGRALQRAEPGHLLLGARDLHRAHHHRDRHLHQAPQRGREGAAVPRVDDLVRPVRRQRHRYAADLRRVPRPTGSTRSTSA